MPEATVNKNYFTASSKGKVGLAGKLRGVKSIAVSQGVNDAPDDKLRLGVL